MPASKAFQDAMWNITESPEAQSLKLINPQRKLHPCDTRCYDLAKIFLQDEDGARHEDYLDLGGQIQMLIEDYIYDHNKRVEAYMSRVET